MFLWLSVPTVLKGKSREITSLHGRTVLSLSLSPLLTFLSPPLSLESSLLP